MEELNPQHAEAALLALLSCGRWRGDSMGDGYRRRMVPTGTTMRSIAPVT